MHSQRGLINLFHSDGQRDAFARRGNAMINQGDDAILLDREGVREHAALSRFRQDPLPDLWRASASARRHGAA
jgi:hypothetical protein